MQGGAARLEGRRYMHDAFRSTPTSLVIDAAFASGSGMRGISIHILASLS